jgi:hypothetical protein
MSHASFSFEIDAESLKKSLSQIKLNKGQVSQMLDLLIAQEKISPEEGEKAKKKLEGMSDEQIQEITQKAVKEINSPATKNGGSLNDYLENIGQ